MPLSVIHDIVSKETIPRKVLFLPTSITHQVVFILFYGCGNLSIIIAFRTFFVFIPIPSKTSEDIFINVQNDLDTYFDTEESEDLF